MEVDEEGYQVGGIWNSLHNLGIKGGNEETKVKLSAIRSVVGNKTGNEMPVADAST